MIQPPRQSLVRLRDRPLESLRCPVERCSSHDSVQKKGLSIRYWRAKETIRYLRCHDCGREFSERQGTPLFNLRISEDKAFDILNHLSEGCGTRKTSRLCKIKVETVIRLQRRSGDHFKLWHDKHVRGLTVEEVQLDEKWSFVGKKTEELRPRGSSRRGSRRSVGPRRHGCGEPPRGVDGPRQAHL